MIRVFFFKKDGDEDEESSQGGGGCRCCTLWARDLKYGQQDVQEDNTY